MTLFEFKFGFFIGLCKKQRWVHRVFLREHTCKYHHNMDEMSL